VPLRFYRNEKATDFVPFTQTLERPPGMGCRDSVPPMATQVTAHITGTVWKIEVKVGDAVTEGQSCVILESMKMEMPVEAPAAGKVASIACKEGQAVSEGDVLLVLD
jgi:acetyl-CoA carboxylase biotin carboxyl carrier protein